MDENKKFDFSWKTVSQQLKLTLLQINNHTEEREGIIKVILENSILIRCCNTKDKKKIVYKYWI